jgi:hypothetical protein
MSIKRETIAIEGTVIYCDTCHKRGPQAAYDNADEVLEVADERGWGIGDTDVCPDCLAAPARKGKKR